MAVAEQSDSSQECGATTLQPMEMVVCAHNGVKFDFPFLLRECVRHGVSWDAMQKWIFVDTLQPLKAVAECVKLQCLAHRCGVEGLSAHRALDDCVCLQAVVTTLAERYGVTALALLKRFALEVDLEAMILHLAALRG